MEGKKKDIRVTKTQRSIAQALFVLLEKQSFSKITVNDICSEALVSRSTFYAHFEDKYRLLQFCLEEVDKRVFAERPDMDLREFLEDTLGKVQANKKILRNLMIAELDVELIEMFRQHYVHAFELRLKQRGLDNGVPAKKLEAVISFYAAGVSQTIALWIAQKLPLSVEEMADVLYELLKGLEQEE